MTFTIPEVQSEILFDVTERMNQPKLVCPQIAPFIPPYPSENRIAINFAEENPISEDEWLYVQDSLKDLASGRYTVSKQDESAEELLRKLEG